MFVYLRVNNFLFVSLNSKLQLFSDFLLPCNFKEKNKEIKITWNNVKETYHLQICDFVNSLSPMSDVLGMTLNLHVVLLEMAAEVC